MTLYRSDAADIGRYVDPGTAQAAVTSPPYLKQRRYGTDPREGGLTDTLEEYVAWLTDNLEHVRTALHPTGLLWLNIGDKANGSGGAGGDWNKPGARVPRGAGSRNARAEGGPGPFNDPAYEVASYLDVGGAVVRQLLARRWRLRAEIIWDKGRQSPESLTYVRRPRSQHEKIYLLSPIPSARRAGEPRTRFWPSMLTEKGTVWHFAPGGTGDPHLAPFPDELARRCILPSTLPGDLVIDPFAGSGTTLRVAEALGRRATGTDLYAGVELEEEATA